MRPDLVAKTDIQFPWKGEINLALGKLVVDNNRGNVVDVGCGTCQVYQHLIKHGWKGEYVGVDAVAYEGYAYPEAVKVILGDALAVPLPPSNTYILFDVLEHVEDPIGLLSKCIRNADNVLIAVPKRNEELWRRGVVEYHQLDRTHKHWGFTEHELRRLVKCSDGQIVKYQELVPIDLLGLLGAFTESDRFYRLMEQLTKLFPTKTYFQELWCEVTKA